MPKHFLLSVLLLLTLTSCQRCQVKKEQERTSPWREIVVFAEKNLPLEGTLVQQPDGYAYVKVDDRYINDLFPKLHADGFEKPPYFRRENSPGAHISVFYEDERVKASEVGKKYRFTLADILLVKTTKKVEYIVLQIKAPELEKLRQKYGLSPLLKDNEFHITIARKVER